MNNDFYQCRGCRHFEDSDWAGCIERVKKTDLDECFNPELSKRQRCIICGSHRVFIELEGKKYCRKCSDNRENVK